MAAACKRACAVVDVLLRDLEAVPTPSLGEVATPTAGTLRRLQRLSDVRQGIVLVESGFGG